MSRLSENSWETYVFCLNRSPGEGICFERRVISLRREGLTRSGEKASLKQKLVKCHCNVLAQARELSLSETILVIWAKVSSLSEDSAGFVFYFPKLVVAGCLS